MVAETAAQRAAMSEMAEKMRVKEDDDDRTILSKKLSYVLRHGAKQLELEINEGGYVSVRELLSCGDGLLFEGVGTEALLEFVEQSNQEKQRYEVVEKGDDWLIRATGKHTMQGLAAARDKRERRSRGGSGVERGTATEKNNKPKQPQQQQHQWQQSKVSEEEFVRRWQLDRLARMRLQELPLASRQLAMQRFSPGPQVPASDYPKVFVAFCKRFRLKGKEDDEQDDDMLAIEAPQVSRSKASQKKKAASGMPGRGGDKPIATAGLRRAAWEEASWEEAQETDAPPSPSPALEEEAEADTSGDFYPSYPSPGSSPRESLSSPSHSLTSSPQIMGLRASPVPTSPSRFLGMTASTPAPPPPGAPPQLLNGQMQVSSAPPPPAYPPHTAPPMPPGALSQLRQAPPPPSHAPQVPGLVAKDQHRSRMFQEFRPGGSRTTGTQHQQQQIQRPQHLQQHLMPQQQVAVRGYHVASSMHEYMDSPQEQHHHMVSQSQQHGYDSSSIVRSSRDGGAANHSYGAGQPYWDRFSGNHNQMGGSNCRGSFDGGSPLAQASETAGQYGTASTPERDWGFGNATFGATDAEAYHSDAFGNNWVSTGACY